jgi:transposase
MEKEHLEFGLGSFPGNGNVKQTLEQEKIALLEKGLKMRRWKVIY